MKKSAFEIVSAAVGLALLCSCITLPAPNVPKTRTFDIGPGPVSKRATMPVDIAAFKSDAPARLKMYYRINDNEVGISEYNKWAQPPAAMLTRYFRGAFQCPKQSKNVLRIYGTVITFEADLRKKEAVLLINYVILDHQGKPPRIIPVETSIPMRNDSPEAYTESMGKAFAMQVEKIQALLKKLPQE